MQDVVWTRWTRVVGSAASVSVVWAMFVPYGFPWMGLLWASLAVTAALWLGATSQTRSLALVIGDVGGEPLPAAAPRANQSSESKETR